VRDAERERERAQGLEDALLCQICCERPRDAVLLPCCHFVSCSVCVGQMAASGAPGGGGGGGREPRRCPVCRGAVHGQVVVHLAAAAAAEAAAGTPTPQRRGSGDPPREQQPQQQQQQQQQQQH
jgi:hypothetical protein